MDGNGHLAFVQRDGQDRPVAMVAADGGAGPPIAFSRRYELHYDLALSPDGKHLAFSAFDRKQTIMVADLPQPFPPRPPPPAPHCRRLSFTSTATACP